MAIPEDLLYLLQGAGTGATTGASIGTAIAPGIGTAIGAGAGALVGIGAGALQKNADEKALAEAEKRDAELQKKLDAVDNLDKFAEVVNVGRAGKEQEAAISAKQAAARGGLSAAAGEGLGETARHNIGLESSAALAGALPAAVQADTAERNRIIGEEFGRQQLLDDASSTEDIIGALGTFGSTAAKAAEITTGEGGLVESLKKTEDVAEPRITGDKAAAVQDVAKNIDNESIVDPRLGTPGSQAGTQKAVADIQVADASQQGREAYLQEFGTGDPTKDYKALFDETSNIMAVDVQTGRITPDEIQMLLASDPSILADPVAWSNAVSNFNTSR